MKIHLGCGDIIKEGFVNVDPYAPSPDVRIDAADYMRSQKPDSSSATKGDDDQGDDLFGGMI